MKGFLYGTLLFAMFLPAPEAKASYNIRATSASNIEYANSNKPGWLGTAVSEVNVSNIRVGDTVDGIKINYIVCKYHTETMPGWRGGPQYVSRAGTHNCWGASSTRDLHANGKRINMIGVRTIR